MYNAKTYRLRSYIISYNVYTDIFDKDNGDFLSFNNKYLAIQLYYIFVKNMC